MFSRSYIGFRLFYFRDGGWENDSAIKIPLGPLGLNHTLFLFLFLPLIGLDTFLHVMEFEQLCSNTFSNLQFACTHSPLRQDTFLIDSNLLECVQPIFGSRLGTPSVSHSV